MRRRSPFAALWLWLMRIGVVSDTHNNLRNVARIVGLFNEANVDLVVHTGDITKGKTIDVLADLSSPMVGVFGNNDPERESLNKAIAHTVFSSTSPLMKWCGHRDVSSSFTIPLNWKECLRQIMI
ncbi:MAG: hypothetical protein CM1200mP9_04390 [Gammaproteobacteria bacterium]|nr:MAG: hypothetical protein CM1200mP9_04390 [Gammaproteobacteria bacterium]